MAHKDIAVLATPWGMELRCGPTGSTQRSFWG
jgi:hypothetical protein